MISLLLILISALFFVGIITKVKAKIAARKMPSVFQPLFDLIRLFKKGAIYSQTTSAIFKFAPLVYAASVLVATLYQVYYDISFIFCIFIVCRTHQNYK